MKVYTQQKYYLLWIFASFAIFLYGYVETNMAFENKYGGIRFFGSEYFLYPFLIFVVVVIIFLGLNVNSIQWNEQEVIFVRWLFKKYRYNWEDIDGVYYCPKIGVVHMNISTRDGEFYPIPNVPDKLYKAIEKYAKVKIKIIRHPMEILPYLRERRKNMRKLRKNWRNS